MSNPMQYAKAYAALIGSIATALLGVYAADTTVGQILTVVAVVATAVATFAIPNTPAPAPAEPLDERGQGSVVVMLLVAILVGIVLLLVGARL